MAKEGLRARCKILTSTNDSSNSKSVYLGNEATPVRVASERGLGTHDDEASARPREGDVHSTGVSQKTNAPATPLRPHRRDDDHVLFPPLKVHRRAHSRRLEEVPRVREMGGGGG